MDINVFTIQDYVRTKSFHHVEGVPLPFADGSNPSIPWTYEVSEIELA